MRIPQAVSLLCFLPLVPALGQELTIDWGSDFIQTGSVIDSDGNAITLGDGTLSDGGYSIELGAFASGFVPTAQNTGSWVSNWRVFDAIIDPDLDDADFLNSGDPTSFAGRDLLDSNNHSLSSDASVNPTDVFAQGEQAYVFVRNSNDTTPGSEWLLYTRTTGGGDSWKYPFVSPESHNRADLLWNLQDADTAIWGGIDDASVVGDGEHTHTGTDYLFQTFTFPAVPEPTTVLLTYLGSLFLFCRRRS